MRRTSAIVLASVVALFFVVVDAHAYPLCATCSCFSNCNQTCSVDTTPGGANDICENWLCRDSPECDSLASASDSRALEAFLFAADGGCTPKLEASTTATPATSGAIAEIDFEHAAQLSQE